MDFTEPWEFGDVTFIVEDKKISVNKTVLAMSSEVFKVMFTAEFAERHMSEIPLPDKRFDGFLELMQVLHPPRNKRIDDNHIERLLPLAHEYQIQEVVERCEKVLVKQPPSIHNLILADKFSLPELRQVCIDYIKCIPYRELKKEQYFKEVEKDTLLEVLEHKLNVKEDKYIQELMRQPPSIKTLLLAEKHKLPQLHEKCVKYAKETPLAKLKEEDGFYDMKSSTLCKVLSHQVEDLMSKSKDLNRTIYNLNPLTYTNDSLNKKISNLNRENVELRSELHNKVKTRYCQCVLM